MTQSTSNQKTGRLLAIAILLVWTGLIFATSCTVILPHDFFQWIAKNVLPNESAFRGFVVFWGMSWFVIVKGWHATEFAILFVLLQMAFNSIAPNQPYRNIIWAIGLSILFAVSDEYHQTFVPERGGTITDVSIDSLGVLLAAWFQVTRLKHQRKT